MIIWRIQRLKHGLTQGGLTPRQVLGYLIAALVLATLNHVVSDWLKSWDRDGFEATLDSIVVLSKGLISAVGLYCCYKANGGANGTQLAERVCAIGVVLFVRFVVYGGLAFIAWVYATVYFNSPFRPAYEELGLFSLLIVALFWIRLRAHIASVAQPAKA